MSDLIALIVWTVLATAAAILYGNAVVPRLVDNGFRSLAVALPGVVSGVLVLVLR